MWEAMKKKINKQRKLRKCELGIKTKSFRSGCTYKMTNIGLIPSFFVDKHV